METEKLVVEILYHFYEQTRWFEDDEFREIVEERARELIAVIRAA